MIQTQWNYKNLSLASCKAELLQKPNTQEQRSSSQAHSGHGVASLGLPQGLTPKMLAIQGGGGLLL